MENVMEEIKKNVNVNVNENSKILNSEVINKKKYKNNQYVSYSNYILSLTNKEYILEYGNIEDLE